MRIERITNGIVMDHIRAGMGIEILKLFPTELLKTKVDYASHVDSPRHGIKDIIKIENLDADPKTLMKMALLSPEVTISIIRDGHVHKKFEPEVPPEVEGVITCTNPKCVTLRESYLTSRFRVELQKTGKHKGRFKQQCMYCEHIFFT